MKDDPGAPETPVRRILHCDMDCFYAAVHMRDDASLRGRPVVVGGDPDGRGVVAAASYEARRFGIHSAMPAARAKRLCPQAVFLRSDFPRYREESAAIFEIYRRFTPAMQTLSLDEAYLDVSDQLDVYASASAVAKEIRLRVHEERRLTVSVGVGPNKLVAKIASDHDKPDGLTVVPPHRVKDFLAPLSVRALMGVGSATEERLGKVGIVTIAELRCRSLAELTQLCGKYGSRLHQFARGIDERPVRDRGERKSCGAERTYAEDIAEPARMAEELEGLSERVAADLERGELLARTVTIKVRYGDFTTVTRSRTLRVPTAEADILATVAKSLLERTEAVVRPVRLLGVSTSKLAREGRDPQLGLF